MSLRFLCQNLTSYARFFRDRVTGFKKVKSYFLSKHGYPLNLDKPKSYSEKIVWKKLFDRDPLLPITADKYRVRSYIESRLGCERAKALLIPLIQVVSDPDEIDFDSLPNSFILKANHGSGTNMIVRNRDASDDQIREACRKWLKDPYGMSKHEWAYQNIKRKVVFEELLRDESGGIPKDYKFFVIHGRCEFLQVDSGRYDNFTRVLYDRDWNPLPVRYKRALGRPEERPGNFEEMLGIAEELGEDFDAVRVGLYTISGRVYFGELTHYPTSGTGKFDPTAFDFAVGEKWRLVPGYWRGRPSRIGL